MLSPCFVTCLSGSVTSFGNTHMSEFGIKMGWAVGLTGTSVTARSYLFGGSSMFKEATLSAIVWILCVLQGLHGIVLGPHWHSWVTEQISRQV